MRKRILLTLLLAAMLVAGCTSAGPYVTDIAYDGEGSLLVTKNTVLFNWFFGTIGTGEHEQTIVIKTPKYDGRKMMGYRIDTSRRDAAGSFERTPVYEDEK